MPTTFNMSDVMISYSRRDKVFVQRVDEALRRSGREVWVDWQDIPATADFLQEIYAGIEAADTFVYIISPDSVRSEVCQLEVQHAIQYHKRLVPVLHQELVEESDKQKLHPAVASHNWIFLRETDDFQQGFRTLITALETDLGHVQRHTRLLVRAREWDHKARTGSLLLRGEDLRDAEAWLTASVHQQPEPTPLQAEYIAASRRAAARFRGIVAAVTTFAMIVLGLLALVAFQQSGVANAALGESNLRGTAVAEQVETANAALTQVDERERQRAAAQQDADVNATEASGNATLSANSAATADANATLSAGNAATAQYNATLSADNAATATSALATALIAQQEAEINLGTAGAAQQEAEDLFLTATLAQGQAQDNILTATVALSTANAAQDKADDALATANSALNQAQNAQAAAVAAQSAAQSAQAQANAAGTQAALAQTQAAVAVQTAVAAQGAANAAGTQAAVEAQRALSLRLASEALVANINGDRPLAMSLAMLANTFLGDNSPAEALSPLAQVARSSGGRFTLEPPLNADWPIRTVAISPDASRVYAAYNNGLIAVWDISNPSAATFGLPLTNFFGKTEANCVNSGQEGWSGLATGFSPDGSRVMVAGPAVQNPAEIPGLTTIALLNTSNGACIATVDYARPNDEAFVWSVVPLNNTGRFALALFGENFATTIYQREMNQWNTYNQDIGLQTSRGYFRNLAFAAQTISSGQLFYFGWSYPGEPRRATRWLVPNTGDIIRLAIDNDFQSSDSMVFAPYGNPLEALSIEQGTQLVHTFLEQTVFENSYTFAKRITIPIDVEDRNITPARPLLALNFRQINVAPNGNAAAVVGSWDNRVTIIDLDTHAGIIVPQDRNSLINWVCQNRYWQYLVHEPADRPNGVTQAMLDSMIARCGQAGAASIAGEPLSVQSLMVAAVIEATPALTLTPTPPPTETAANTPTPDSAEPIIIESDDTRVLASPGWSPLDSSIASGGRLLVSTVEGDSLGLIFEGTAISIIYLQHPAMGSFTVEVDGVLYVTVTAAAEPIMMATATVSGLTPGAHTLLLKPIQNPVAIDTFILNAPIITTPTLTATPSLTASALPVATETPILTPSLTETPTLTLTATLSETPSLIPSLTETPTVLLTASETPTATLPPPAETEAATG